MAEADLQFWDDPEDPGDHLFVRGNPVPPPLRTQLKHLGGRWLKDREVWHIRKLMGRKVWADAQEQGFTVEHIAAPTAPTRRQFAECPDCHGARWTDEPGCCPHCGSASRMIPPPGTHHADAPAAPPVDCPSCGASASPGPRHCTAVPTHRVDRNANYCPQVGCGAVLCDGLARWDRHVPPEGT